MLWSLQEHLVFFKCELLGVTFVVQPRKEKKNNEKKEKKKKEQ